MASRFRRSRCSTRRVARQAQLAACWVMLHRVWIEGDNRAKLAAAMRLRQDLPPEEWGVPPVPAVPPAGTRYTGNDCRPRRVRRGELSAEAGGVGQGDARRVDGCAIVDHRGCGSSPPEARSWGRLAWRDARAGNLRRRRSSPNRNSRTEEDHGIGRTGAIEHRPVALRERERAADPQRDSCRGERRPRRVTSRSTLADSAPSAMRMPISRVRCATANATRP